MILNELLTLGEIFNDDIHPTDFIVRAFPESQEWEPKTDIRCKSRLDEVYRHMEFNDDWTIRQLFFDILELISVSDAEFIRFLEVYVSPDIKVLSHDGNMIISQSECVNAINQYLESNGYRLEIGDAKGNNKFVYKAVPIKQSLFANKIANIIFAAQQKPDIVISDMLGNKLDILENEKNYLVYDQEIPITGLSWSDMVSWYGRKYHHTSEWLEAEYIARLKQSIGKNSPPEELFFEAYIEFVKEHSGMVPALIPQVHLYYDPKTKDNRGRKYFEHQRMDFVFILSNDSRIVIEIDGQQHYAEDEEVPGTNHRRYAVPGRYAEMAAAHREMVLSGYEVYRFGGVEFPSKFDWQKKESKSLVKEFLSRLFKKYHISGIKESEVYSLP